MILKLQKPQTGVGKPESGNREENSGLEIAKIITSTFGVRYSMFDI